MPLHERILMGPGPSNPYPEVMSALGRPMLGHLDPEFLAILDETCDRLRAVFRTDNAITLPISGTGSAGMEAAFVNVVGPGDVVVVGVNGLFGERMCDVAARCGGQIVRVDAPWGRALEPQQLLDAHANPKVIAVVHAETSTGVRNDVGAIGAGKGDALLLVDCVTSLGGIEVAIDEWGVDIAYSGTQKCLGVPPGLSPFTMNTRAFERRVEKSQSWYLDLGMIAEYAVTPGPAGPAPLAQRGSNSARKYHHTAPVSMIFALHAGLGAVLDEGLEVAWARHAECGARVQEGLDKLGFELLAAEGHRLPQLTTARLPQGVEDGFARRALLDRFGIEVGGGVGPWAGTAWRVGCMGNTARLRNVAAFFGAVEEVIRW